MTDLICNTWVSLDLSTAAFLLDGDGDPTGQFSGGVIWATGVGDQNFYFPVALDPTKAHTFEITFDPMSAHDDGQRKVNLWAVRPGSEQSDFDAFTVAGLESNGHPISTDVGDVVTFTVGPALTRVDDGSLFSGVPDWNDGTGGVVAGWTRPFIETDRDSATSSVRIMQICPALTTTAGQRLAPLRIHPRSDGLGLSSAPRIWPLPPSVQASNRRAGGYL